MSKSTFILSDSSVENSFGFRIDLKGMDLNRFKSNPVMLYMHEPDKVIGKWNNVRVEEGKLLADAEFDVEDAESKKIAGKVKRGFLKGASLGIRIRKMSEKDDCLYATKSELMEASIVSVPSDSGAIVLYDNDNKVTSIEAVKLQFKNNLNTIKMTENTELKLQAELSEVKAQSVKLAADIKERDDKIASLEAAIAEQKKQTASNYLLQAVADGRITEAERANFEKLAASDFEAVKAVIEAKPKQAGVSLAAAAAAEKGKGTAKSWDELDRAGRLVQLKAEDPETFKRLFKEKFGVEPKI